jgi:hypothetical protein
VLANIYPLGTKWRDDHGTLVCNRTAARHREAFSSCR